MTETFLHRIPNLAWHKSRQLKKSIYSWLQFQAATSSPSSSETLPDFIVIGAARSGSSFLFNSILKQKCIIPPRLEDIFFFDKRYKNGMAWYKKYFRRTKHPEYQLTGECSSFYIYHPQAATRIKQAIPNVKLIAVLRNPIDRAYLHYYMMRRFGLEVLTSFEEAIEAEPTRLSGEYNNMISDPTYYSLASAKYSYLDRGKYAMQLRRYFDLFPKEQLLVICSEDMFKDPFSELKKVSIFLEIDDFTKLATWQNEYYYPPMNPDTRIKLEQYFKPYNNELSSLLGRAFW